MSGKDKPLVTLALLAYNQERYIREAMISVLAQDYQHLEIIISDDRSTDHTFDVIREIASHYVGPHRIILNQNEANLGLVGHVNRMFALSNGKLLVLAAGDDISHSSRVSTLTDAWLRSGSLSAVVHSSARVIRDREAGVETILPRRPKSGPHSLAAYLGDGMVLPYLGCTAAYTTDIHAAFGDLDPKGSIEDQPLAFRAILLKAPMIYVNEVLVDYRVTGHNMSVGHSRADRVRLSRWIRAMQKSVAQQISDYRSINGNDPLIGKKMHAEYRRLVRLESIVSNNPLRIAAGIILGTKWLTSPKDIAKVFEYFGLSENRAFAFAQRAYVSISKTIGAS